MKKIKVGISSCLLGNKVRYDGRHALDQYITETLGQSFLYVPVCPEKEYGLPVPREPMILTGNIDRPRLVTVDGRTDHTDGLLNWAACRNGRLAKEGLGGFIFKCRSPSCGLKDVQVYTASGTVSGRGTGIFARAFMERFPQLPVIDNERLHDLTWQKNFRQRVMNYQRRPDF